MNLNKKSRRLDMFKKGLWMGVFMVSLALTGTVEGKDRYGQALPKGVEVVKLKEIVENPKAYKGKEVVLEGNFGGVCSDGEDFYFKEGLEIVEVVPKDFPMPKFKKGKAIRVYGVVKSIEKKEKEEKGKEKGEEHNEVTIEAKGVEAR